MSISISNSNDIVGIITIIVSIISMLFSLSVVIILLTHYNTFVNGILLMHNILIIAICDTLVSFSYALGYQSQSYHNICAIQGFISINSERASWLWTDCLLINIYGIIVCHKYIIKKKAMHIIIWFITILLAFIPYINDVGYGTTTTNGKTRCGYSSSINNSNSNNIYANRYGLLHYVICVFSLILIVMLTIRIYLYILSIT